MSGTGSISAVSPPADSPSGHAATDSHHSGQIQAITTVAVPHAQRRRANRINRPSAPAGCGVRQAQKGPRRTQFSHHRARNRIPAPEERALSHNQAKRQTKPQPPPPPPHDNQGTRHRALLTRIFPRHGAALNGRGQRSKWREGRNRVGHQAHISSVSPGGLPSGHAAQDSHHSGQIQAITTVVVPRGQRGRANPTNRPSAQLDAE